MAVYRIESLNYMTAGKDRVFINMDTRCLDSTLSDIVALIQVSADSALSVATGDSPAALRADAERNFEKNVRKKIAYNDSLSARGRTVELERNIEGGWLNRLSATETGERVLGAYEIEDVCMKSQNDQVGYGRVKFDNPNTPRQDTYIPQIHSQPIQFCATGSSTKTYMVMEESEKMADILGMVQDDDTNSYVMQLSSKEHVTVAYSPRKSGETYAQMISSDPETSL